MPKSASSAPLKDGEATAPIAITRTMNKVITEAEFIAYEDMQLALFAKEIVDSGISLYEIAHACNISWEVVKAAASAMPVRFSTQCRIKMYLEYKKQHQQITI